MLQGRVIVFDVGKTLAKLSVWDSLGRLLTQRSRPNRLIESGGFRTLDTEGIEAWAAGILGEFARLGGIVALVPIGHGAAAAIVRKGRLACAVPDYEDALPPSLRVAYEAQRDAFALTGSPALPNGLNLGAQLFRLEHTHRDLFNGGTRIIPWPQYWAWRLCGVMASEVSSFGCHSDLWRPGERGPSALARTRGWAACFPPLRRADEVLGTLTPEWQQRTGLQDVRVYCGVHDSNAALLAARGYPELAQREATVLSTGTWFVAMRTPDSNTDGTLAVLPERRDCLVNVDVEGRAIPSARFMGGREIELLGGIDSDADPETAVRAVLDAGILLLPSWTPGVGPWPDHRGAWTAEPQTSTLRRAAVSLYAALMADTLLELIGTRERLLIEGRFAQARTFVSALATLRPDLHVYVQTGDGAGVAYGALRLVNPALPPPGDLKRVTPLALDVNDLNHYRERWRRSLETREQRI